MCLAVLALRCVPGVPVLIAANRDEFHARPTAPAARWEGEPAIYAGRDLQAGGTWMGASDRGRHALVTNFRDPAAQRSGAPSRGALVDAYLRGADCPRDYMMAVAREGHRYNGFNLIVGDTRQTWYYGNRGEAPQLLPSGVYALSNHLLDTPWPKLLRLKAAFTRIIGRTPQPDLPALYAALADRQRAADDELPDTGVGLIRERMLSSPFIVSPDYGTRVSTILALHAQGRGELHERSFDPAGAATADTALAFDWRDAR